MGLINRFLSFDKLMASALIKFFYYVGLVAIALGTLFAMVTALTQIGNDAGAALLGFVAAPAIGLLALVYFRVICEMFLVIFKISQQLDKVNENLVSGPRTFE